MADNKFDEGGYRVQGAREFVSFSPEFFKGKTLVFEKVSPWEKDGKQLGSRVRVVVAEDKTHYAGKFTNNVGAQLTIRVPGMAPEAFAGCVPEETVLALGRVTYAAARNLSYDGSAQLTVDAELSPVKAGE